MKNKILKIIPVIGVSNVVVLIIVTIICVWTDNYDTWWKTAATCFIFHIVIATFEKALKAVVSEESDLNE